MPVMDGIKAHQELKKLMSGKELEYAPVFALTAYSNEKQNCMSEGMEGFIEKPIIMQDLVKTLHSYFVKDSEK